MEMAIRKKKLKKKNQTAILSPFSLDPPSLGGVPTAEPGRWVCALLILKNNHHPVLQWGYNWGGGGII